MVKPVRLVISLFAPDAAAPKAVRAPDAVVAPVPPYVIAIAVPFHVPDVIVVKLALPVAVNAVNVAAAGVVPPMVVPLIVPPVIATALAFCVAILPRPVTWLGEIEIGVLDAAVIWP